MRPNLTLAALALTVPHLALFAFLAAGWPLWSRHEPANPVAVAAVAWAHLLILAAWPTLLGDPRAFIPLAPTSAALFLIAAVVDRNSASSALAPFGYALAMQAAAATWPTGRAVAARAAVLLVPLFGGLSASATGVAPWFAPPPAPTFGATRILNVSWVMPAVLAVCGAVWRLGTALSSRRSVHTGCGQRPLTQTAHRQPLTNASPDA